MNRLPGRHVGHLLAAYVAGQTSPRRAARIGQHVAACPSCRSRLAQHERAAADLRLALAQIPAPRPPQIEAWWQGIAARQAEPALRLAALRLLAPVLLSLLILTLPVITAGFGAGWASGTAPVTTAALPVVDVSLEPPLAGSPTLTITQQRPAVSGTPIPITPALPATPEP